MTKLNQFEVRRASSEEGYTRFSDKAALVEEREIADLEKEF